jgi:outer membrane protein assembly factor BamB
MKIHQQISVHFSIILFTVLNLLSPYGFNDLASCSDWNTYMHDNQRSGVSNEKLNFPLSESWQYISRHAPKPAWPSPAKIDYWHREANIKPRVTFDRAYHVVSAGNLIYFGSSSNDKIYCLDVSTGLEKWSFFAGGPIRLAPTISQGNIYFGADDGYVYCLNGKNGKVIWSFEATKSERIIPGNERVISVMPVRTGIIIENGIVYFCAGIFPNEGVIMFALDAKTGKKIWDQPSDNLSPQGYMLVSSSRMFVPTGRSTPEVFSLEDGRKLGTFAGNGGTFALLDGEMLVYGGGDLGELEIREPNSKDQIASFNGLQIIIQNDVSYLRSDNEISAINRTKHSKVFKKWKDVEDNKRELADDLWDLREKRKLARDEKRKKRIDAQMEKVINKITNIEKKKKNIESGGLLWQQPLKDTYAMIATDNALFIGGDGIVEAFDKNNGKLLWSGFVNGKAYGLVVANGNLFVSTEKGSIHCFNGGNQFKAKVVSPKKDRNPYPKDKLSKLYSSAAKQVIKDTGIEKGYCIVFGCGEGRLMFELAKRTDLKIIGIDDDKGKVLAARKALDEAGLYGVQTSVHFGSLSKLPFSQYIANLIVSDNALISENISTPADEVFRIVKPYGGVAYIMKKDNEKQLLEKWVDNSSQDEWKIFDKKFDVAKIQRGGVNGSGEWTHLYANAANTLCSQDSLQYPMQIQWFGRPGPRRIINRHSRPMSSLFKDGRIFIPADNRVISVDAYNGTLLWELDVPNSRILGAMKDAGSMAVTDKYVYIAADNLCKAVDMKMGDVAFDLKAPQLIKGEKRDWGYLAAVEDQIIGTAKKPGASFTMLGKFNCEFLEGDFRDVIVSDYIFSLNRLTGKKLWDYRNGVILNSTLAVADGFVYFVESRYNKVMSDIDGRMPVDDFCKAETYIIKLNKKTGRKVWEKDFRFPFQQIMFLSSAQNIILITGSYNKGRDVHYGLFAFYAETGKMKWKNNYRGGNTRWQINTGKKTIGGSHGEQWQHPVIIGDTIYLPPYDFNLHTGEKGNYYLTRGGHGCGGLSGSAKYMFARGTNPRIYQLTNEAESGTPLTKVNRPGCWINIIPAGGLVMIPESSSGCTCNYPIQSSFVFVPKSSD